MGDGAATRLFSALQLPKCALRILSCAGCHVGQHAGHLLGGPVLRSGESALTELNLSSNPQMGTNGCLLIAKGLRWARHLRVLNMDDCGADDAVAEALIDSLDYPQTDEVGAPAAAAALTPPAETPAQDALSPNESLETLCVDDNLISRNVATRLVDTFRRRALVLRARAPRDEDSDQDAAIEGKELSLIHI